MIINKNNLCKNKNHINYKHVISILIIIKIDYLKVKKKTYLTNKEPY